MNDTIAFWINFFGGVNIGYVAAVSVAGTQIVKIAAKASGYDKPAVFRLLSYMFGAYAGLEFIGGTQGPLIGIAVAGIASGLYYALAQWLKNSPEKWKQAVARHMSGEYDAKS